MNYDSEVNVFIDVKREFYIDKIGYMYDHNLDSNFEFSGECHNFTEIAYLESGVIEIVSGENVYILRDGDIIFHMPMAFHKLKNKGNCVAKLRNLSFIHCGEVPLEIYSGVYSLDNSQKSDFNMMFDVTFVSPKKYFLHLKAQEAARRLCCGEQVSDVSDIMGFSSPNYFSYFFKKAFGVTPKDYRNSFLK